METLLLDLLSVSAYRNILEHDVMKHFIDLLEIIDREDPNANSMVSLYSKTYFLIRKDGFDSMYDFLLHHLRYDDSPYAAQCMDGNLNSDFSNVARQDLIKFSRLAKLPCRNIKAAMARSVDARYAKGISELAEWPKGKDITLEELYESYKRKGFGLFSLGKAFHWEYSALTLVKNPDPIDYLEMIGYEWQRQEVIDNTRGLIEGKPANNILLYGDSGTGKSATIKSLISIPEFYNLRMIEISKESLIELKELIRLLTGKNLKFIIFIDDLTYESDDQGYSILKSILEGGLEVRPDNVVIYATSNRRHLVKEYFSDRQGDDIHTAETIQERSSLADRFGLKIPFMSLNKEQYLDMVSKMVEYAGLEIDEEEFIKEANKWELEHAGRTPRIARQFVDYLQNISM